MTTALNTRTGPNPEIKAAALAALLKSIDFNNFTHGELQQITIKIREHLDQFN